MSFRRINSRYFENRKGSSMEENKAKVPPNVNLSLWRKNTVESDVHRFNSLPSKISGALTREQIYSYQVMFRIQEITIKLRTNDFAPPPGKIGHLLRHQFMMPKVKERIPVSRGIERN